MSHLTEPEPEGQGHCLFYIIVYLISKMNRPFRFSDKCTL